MRFQKLIEMYASFPHLFSPYGYHPWSLMDHADILQGQQQSASGQSPKGPVKDQVEDRIVPHTTSLSELQVSR